jgi:hypothetical protein
VWVTVTAGQHRSTLPDYPFEILVVAKLLVVDRSVLDDVSELFNASVSVVVSKAKGHATPRSYVPFLSPDSFLENILM